MTVHRGRVSAVDTAGVFVRAAALGPDVVGPLEWLGTKPGVDEGVLVLNAGSESAPDLVVVGTATGNSPRIMVGTGSPESVVTAPVGSLWLRTNGGASTTLYVKESGTGTTGWVGK